MSSISSFVCLSSNIESDRDTSEWTQISTTNINQIDHHNDQHNDHHNSDQQEEAFSDFNIIQTDNPSTNISNWSAVDDNDFDIHSIPSRISMDTVQAHYRFNDYNFNRKRKIPHPPPHHSSKWVWLNKQRRKGSRRKRGRKARMTATMVPSLCVIDENGEIEEEKEEEYKQETTKTILDVKDLNDFINDTIKINDNIMDVINLCNQISKDGILHINGIEIELHEVPLIGLKLRDIFFRKLILLNHNKIDQDYQYKYMLRREVWLRLNWNSRIYLCPFASFEEFRDLYKVHYTVKSNEFLSVIDDESFDILTKPEWVRIVLLKTYILKQQKFIEMEYYDKQIEEINTLITVGAFNNDDVVNQTRFKHEQLSMIMSDDYCRTESKFSDSFQAFDALEREIGMELQFESDLVERSTNRS